MRGVAHAPQTRVVQRVPAIMALAVISTAFTGQAIAVAFDRRYGALKRLGATALPVWGIIAGKSLAVVTVVFLQGGRPTFGPKAAEIAGRMYRNLYDHNFFVGKPTLPTDTAGVQPATAQ